MEQTENEFGIPYKAPKVKNEEQEAVQHFYSGKQSFSDSDANLIIVED